MTACRILAVDPKTSRALVAEGVLAQAHWPRLWLVTPFWQAVAPPWLGAHVARRLGWIPCEVFAWNLTDAALQAAEIARLPEGTSRVRDPLGSCCLGISRSRSVRSFLRRRDQEITRAHRLWGVLEAHVNWRRSECVTPDIEAAFRATAYRVQGLKPPVSVATLSEEDKRNLQGRIRQLLKERKA